MALGPIDPATSGFDYALVPPAGATRGSVHAEPMSVEGSAQTRELAANAQAAPTATLRPAEYAAGSRAAGSGTDGEHSGESGQNGRENTAGTGVVVILSPEGKEASATYQSFTPQEQAQLNQLKQRDREVRTHEQAHKAAGGRYVRGGASYDYQTGPDGRQYAVGGEVSIDASEASTPQATIGKAQTIRRAALAPAQPSATDRQVAAKASQMEREARAEFSREKAEEAELAAEQKEQGMAPAPAPEPSSPTSAAYKPLSAYV